MFRNNLAFAAVRSALGQPQRLLRKTRTGIATLYVLLALPLIMVLLCLVVETANLWCARAALATALESAALAAVQEWGDASSGGTQVPRQVGVEFAAANSIGGNPVAITTNYSAANAPNQNASCTGNLVFGAITDTNPVIFNSGATPACGVAGVVMFDATGQGNLAADNAWGIAFRNTVDTPPDLQIERIIIDLAAGGGGGQFDNPPLLSDNVQPHKVQDNSGNDQPDILGFADPGSQINFSISGQQLIIDFSADPGGMDQGFEPGNRFRFGASVDGVSQGGGADDGDGIGRDGVAVTVYFSQGGVLLLPVSATFVDSMERAMDCFNPAMVDLPSGSLIVNPNGVPDLPCPESSAPGNNGQSFVELTGGGGGELFAVHAQASVSVDGICENLFGWMMGSKTITASTTAVYDCDTQQVSLTCIDQFVCP